jgi:hypothetical protein
MDRMDAQVLQVARESRALVEPAAVAGAPAAVAARPTAASNTGMCCRALVGRRGASWRERHPIRFVWLWRLVTQYLDSALVAHRKQRRIAARTRAVRCLM